MNVKVILLRLFYCLIGWGTVGIVYNYTGQVTAHATWLTPSVIDNALPFSAQAVWMYLSFFIFIPIGYLSCTVERARSLMYAMQLCAMVSGIVYLIFPTTMAYPAIEGHSLTQRALSLLISVDSPQNLLPSLHVSLTLVVLNALWARQRKYRNACYLVWAVAICVSVLILKRHLFVDVITGAITAYGAIWLVSCAQNRFRRNCCE